MKTNIYHIVYTPETKEASLFFWGCNIDCRGCYCRRRIYSAMLKDFRIDVSENDLSRPPAVLGIKCLVDGIVDSDFGSAPPIPVVRGVFGFAPLNI